MTGSLTQLAGKGFADPTQPFRPVRASQETLQAIGPGDNRRITLRRNMVQIRSRDPVVVYEVLDGAGRLIGEVMQPTGEPVMGWGEETLLLRRPAPRLGGNL